MDPAIKERIAPMVPKNSQTFSDASIKNPTIAKDGDPKVDFKSLLQTSNSDMSRERVAKNPKDLAAAKTEDEFYKMLSDRANPNSGAPKNKLDKDDFLKLFVAQLRNQDPLKPDDATQMAAQLAQFNGLEQMMNVNKNLEQLTKLQEGGQAVSLLDYVGKEVTVDGGRLMVDKGQLTSATYTIDQPTSGAELEVRDSTGLVIATKPLGVLSPGEHDLSWDGVNKDGEKVKDGVYSFAVVAQGLDGGALPAAIKSKVRITGVDMKDPGGSFFTDLGKVSVGEISSVGVTGFAARSKQVAAPAIKPGPEVKPPTKEQVLTAPEELVEGLGQNPAIAPPVVPAITTEASPEGARDIVPEIVVPASATSPMGPNGAPLRKANELSPGAREIAVNPG